MTLCHVTYSSPWVATTKYIIVKAHCFAVNNGRIGLDHYVTESITTWRQDVLGCRSCSTMCKNCFVHNWQSFTCHLYQVGKSLGAKCLQTNLLLILLHTCVVCTRVCLCLYMCVSSVGFICMTWQVEFACMQNIDDVFLFLPLQDGQEEGRQTPHL